MLMSGSEFLIDTNIIIEVFNGNKNYADKIHKLAVIYVPSIVLGELYTGINRVANKARHLKMLNDFLQLCTIVEVNGQTAINYGEIVAQLYKKGKPIPINDVWIAAIAIQYNFTLVTNDGHFKQINKLQTEKWQ
jgi:tRNA(fMet)-specific endonuclease VapC